MTLLLPTLAVAFAAFCVWLTVRIVNRRERWAKWTAGVLIGVPALYVASFGPACWAVTRKLISVNKAAVVYKPIVRISWDGPKPCHEFFGWYADSCGGYWAFVAMDDYEEWDKAWQELMRQSEKE